MVPATSTDVIPSAKQIVFLFMAATVGAVVVFLCGVLVGRGVPLRLPGDPITVGLDGTPVLDDRPAVIGSYGGGLSVAAESGEDLTYYTRLESDEPVVESLRGLPDFLPTVSTETPDPVDESLDPPFSLTESMIRVEGSEMAKESLPATEPYHTKPTSVREPTPEEVVSLASRRQSDVSSPTTTNRLEQGFAVQVAAYRERATARRIANDLVDKGFPTFIVYPTLDAPVAVYRVRVGPYGDRQEAERIRQRLEREEQLKPWVTR